MKRIICNSLVLLLMINGGLKAQVKSDIVYKSLKGFSITIDENKLVHIEYGNKTVTERVRSELSGITRLKFINDSLAQVKSKSGSMSDIQINNIVSATFRREDGSHVGIGAVVGILGGAVIGGVIGNEFEQPGWFHGVATVGGILTGIVIGGVTGLIIGSNISAESEEVHDLSHSANKKAKLEALLKKNMGR
jgi:hypothetical protein